MDRMPPEPTVTEAVGLFLVDTPQDTSNAEAVSSERGLKSQGIVKS